MFTIIVIAILNLFVVIWLLDCIHTKVKIMRKDIDHLKMMESHNDKTAQTCIDLIIKLQNEIAELKSKLIK